MNVFRRSAPISTVHIDETAIVILSRFDHQKLKEFKKKFNVIFTNLTVTTTHEEAITFFETTFGNSNLNFILALYRNIDKVFRTKLDEGQSSRLANVIAGMRELSTDEISIIKAVYFAKKESDEGDAI